MSAGIQRKPIETVTTRVLAWSQEPFLQEEPWVLLVHSPLLQQSRLLAVPPLSDMLKLSGSFHVRQVTGPTTVGGRLVRTPHFASLIRFGEEADSTHFATGAQPRLLVPSTINQPLRGCGFGGPLFNAPAMVEVCV